MKAIFSIAVFGGSGFWGRGFIAGARFEHTTFRSSGNAGTCYLKETVPDFAKGMKFKISPEGFVHKLVAHNGKIETIQIEY